MEVVEVFIGRATFICFGAGLFDIHDLQSVSLFPKNSNIFPENIFKKDRRTCIKEVCNDHGQDGEFWMFEMVLAIPRFSVVSDNSRNEL